jgi:hypothetical protein
MRTMRLGGGSFEGMGPMDAMMAGERGLSFLGRDRRRRCWAKENARQLVRFTATGQLVGG